MAKRGSPDAPSAKCSSGRRYDQPPHYDVAWQYVFPILPRLSASNPRELKEAFEVMTMVTTSEMVIRSALLRKESRGDHYRVDYPERDDKNWLKSITINQKDSHMELGTQPVSITRFRPE